MNDRIKEIRTTENLVDSPARLVDPEGSPSQEIQKAYKYLQKDLDTPLKILEINPHHPIIANLAKIEGINPIRELIIEQLFENALITDGVQFNSSNHIKRVNKIIEAALQKE